METFRPLAYDGLKTVLQYMEPNLRFTVANRIPSIASTEKTVPLKIEKLGFYPYEIVVNETSYKLGTYRHYPPGVTALVVHQADNSERGVSWDLDQYGFEDHSSEAIVTPGDVVIKDESGTWRRPAPEQDVERLETRLKLQKSTLAEWTRRNLDRNNQIKVSTDHIEEDINQIKADLDSIYCRRNDTRPVYTTMVQFTVTYPNEKKEISRKPYDMKLYEVQKKLADRLFGNRKSEIFVKLLDIGFLSPKTAQIAIRLPLNFQIKVQEIKTISNVTAVCDAIQSLVHRSSYPLDRFIIDTNPVYLSSHPTVCTAKKLFFGNDSFFDDKIFGFLRFSHQRMYVMRNRFTIYEHIVLLRRWIEERRAVGTYFYSKFEEADQDRELYDSYKVGEAFILDIFAKCKKQLRGYDAGERFVKVPMSESSEISLIYQALEKRGTHTADWELTIEVVAV